MIERIIESVDAIDKPKDKCLKCGSENLYIKPLFGAAAHLICKECGHIRCIID